jgi:N6-adenosine-specific RNA methylase IME4
MDNDAIAALPIHEMASEQAHLYLWTTNPHIFGTGLRGRSKGPSPIEMVKGWGFTYMTLLTWHKQGAPGMGWYFRGDTEHVLFGVRGKLGIPEKPDRFYEIVEGVSPAPRLDMFARRQRSGWDVWGNEV